MQCGHFPGPILDALLEEMEGWDVKLQPNGSSIVTYVPRIATPVSGHVGEAGAMSVGQLYDVQRERPVAGHATAQVTALFPRGCGQYSCTCTVFVRACMICRHIVTVQYYELQEDHDDSLSDALTVEKFVTLFKATLWIGASDAAKSSRSLLPGSTVVRSGYLSLQVAPVVSAPVPSVGAVVVGVPVLRPAGPGAVMGASGAVPGAGVAVRTSAPARASSSHAAAPALGGSVLGGAHQGGGGAVAEAVVASLVGSPAVLKASAKRPRPCDVEPAGPPDVELAVVPARARPRRSASGHRPGWMVAGSSDWHKYAPSRAGSHHADVEPPWGPVV